MEINSLKLLIMASKRLLYAFLVQVIAMQFLLATPSNSQNLEDVSLSISVQSNTLEEVLELIQEKTLFNFTYNQKVVRDNNQLTFSFPESDLKEVLQHLAQVTSFEFKRVNKTIYVKPVLLSRDTANSLSDPVSDSYNPEKVFIPIKGTVLDEEGNPIPGATVIIEGTTTGTVTDIDGNFSLNADPGAVIKISFIGYKSETITVGNQTSFSITLEDDQAALDEVVVVGYGTQKKDDVTGSVSSVNQKAIKNLPVSTLDQKMVGQAAGVQIQQVSGAPGAGTSVKIRGSGSLGAGNEPLYVIDGMPYSSGMNQTLNPLMFIDPNNIESITILKDASSTAIYGSRGANGVIMITTKKGELNQTNINFSSMVGIQQVPQKGRPQLLNQREFAQFQRDRIAIGVRQTEGREPTLSDFPQEYRDLDALTGQGTDWYDLVLQTAQIQDHNFSMQKGSKDSRINFSLGYFQQEGVLKHTGIERFSSNLGIESNLTNKLKIGASIQPTFIKQDRANTNLNRGDILGVSIWANPISTPYDQNGNLKPYIVAPQSRFHSAWSFVNPLFALSEIKMQQNTFQNLGLAFAELEILPNLRFRSSLNTIFEVSKFEQFIPSSIGGSNRPPTPGTGSSFNSRSNSFDWLIENTVNYDLTKGDHRINALLGYTTQKFTSNNISLGADPFPNDLIRTINAAQNIDTWGEAVNEWSMISYLGRVNYALKDKYLFTATFRSDGSSRFGNQNRFAMFPSIAAAWRVSEEDFFQNINWMDEFKIRASYGKSGNNNIGNYAHLASINAGSYVFGNNQVTASNVGLSNPFLTWEESNQIDLGLDFQFMDSRLSLLIDLYRRESNNMLLNDVIPTITGFNSQTINQGNVRNMGLEIALGGSPYVGTFSWDINANIAFNRNKVMSLNDNTVRILAGNNDGNPTHVSVVGKPIGQFYGFVLEGVYTPEDMENPDIVKTPQVYEGNVKYRDVNGDGLINDVLDYTIIGNPHPDFIFGLTNNFAYKSIDLGIILNGQSGGQVMNGLRQTTDNLQGFFNVDRVWENRWRSTENPGDGIHSGIPQVRPSWGHRVSTLWVEDASYLRISNLTLGYTLPGNFLERLKVIKGSRIYLTVQNLAMFTNYKGANPEGQAANQNNTLVPGFDMTSYPLSRTTSLGINLSF
jgi:TonB-linked SusC/RagA family outer membrane protein